MSSLVGFARHLISCCCFEILLLAGLLQCWQFMLFSYDVFTIGVVCFNLSRLIVVKKLLQVAIEIYHYCFAAAKEHDFFGHTFGGMHIVGHLHFPVQIQNSLLIEQHGVVNGIGIVFQLQLLDKHIIANQCESHASVFSQIEPPGRHGSFQTRTLFVGQQSH